MKRAEVFVRGGLSTGVKYRGRQVKSGQEVHGRSLMQRRAFACVLCSVVLGQLRKNHERKSTPEDIA